MPQGYFAGLLAFFYRETVDGQRVVPRRIAPLFPAQWMIVTPELRERFERRFKWAHIAAMIALTIGIQVVGDDPSYLELGVVAVGAALIASFLGQWWATAGLPRLAQGAAALLPVKRFEMSERQARAMGPRTRVAFIVLGWVLALPQLLVAILQDFPLGYFGFVLFAGTAVFSWYLHLKIARDDAALPAPGVPS